MANQVRNPTNVSAAGTARPVVYHQDPEPHLVRRISPSAVIAGALVALVVLFMLNLLGIGIGLSTLDPAPGGDGSPSLASLGMGAGIWGVISFLVALFLGGWIAGRLAGDPNAVDGMLHGLVAWALALFVVVWIVGSAASSLVGGAVSLAGNTVSGVAQGAEATATSEDGGVLELIPWEEAQARLEQALPADVELDRETLMSALERFWTQGRDREAVVQVLVAEGGLSRQQAETAMRELEQEYQSATEQIQDQAGENAGDSAELLSSAALWAFFALALAAVAASVGGWVGAPRDRLARIGAGRSD